MPELNRTQVAVYGAIAVALLFVGARAVRGEDGGGGASGEASSYEYSSGSDAEGEGEGESESDQTFSVEGGGSDVVVDVTGAVRRPGVYRLPAGSRVNDAVKRAGGATGRAALAAINLAARLADGQQVAVPAEVPGAAGGGAVAAGATAGAAAEDAPISLATATVAELDTIDGIGPVTAEGIVDFREEHGGLASVEQLDQISGIGPATMEALRERLQP